MNLVWMEGVWLTVLQTGAVCVLVAGRLCAMDTCVCTHVFLPWPCPFVLTLFWMGCAEKGEGSPPLPDPFSLPHCLYLQ